VCRVSTGAERAHRPDLRPQVWWCASRAYSSSSSSSPPRQPSSQLTLPTIVAGTHKILNLLHKNKLLHHENRQYDSYRLTPMGYDYLALNALRQRDSVTNFGKQIGVGKEADIYLVSNEEQEALCCKIHRLGRTSFRNIKAQRDYLQHRKSASWLYLSRLSAVKEYAFMRVLYEHGFPVPEPIDHSRHIVIMRLIEGTQLNQIAELGEPEHVYDTCMSLIVRLVRAHTQLACLVARSAKSSEAASCQRSPSADNCEICVCTRRARFVSSAGVSMSST